MFVCLKPWSCVLVLHFAYIKNNNLVFEMIIFIMQGKSFFWILYLTVFFILKGEVGQPGSPGLEGHRGDPVSD